MAATAGLLILTSGAAAQNGFDDAGGTHEPAINALAGEGILEGTECGERRICPDDPLLRRVMGVWLVRAAKESPATSATRFTDLDPSVWWTPYVERLAELEITQGCTASPARYCPDQPVTRGQMATFLTRAFDLEDGPPAGFTDTDGHRRAEAIDALAAARITTGCGENRYCPDAVVTRGQMATFLARALNLTARPETPVAVNDPRGFTAVTAGDSFSCGIRTNGSVTCWGYNRKGQTDAPYRQLTTITTGDSHTCGIRTNNTITCWGDDLSRQTDAPTGQFTTITAGSWHTCGIRTDNTVTCWGNLVRPTDIPTGQFTAITAGSTHSCGIRNNGAVTCWGDNDYVRVDAPTGQFTTITAGIYFSCGIRTNNTVTCWGNNRHGETDTPDGQFTAITTGSLHSCGIRTDNTVTCWGNNGAGETDAPTGQFTAITAGSAHHSCGIRTDNTVTCWGDNRYGQIDAPTGQFTAITAGNTHSCGIRTNGAVTCWGNVKIHLPPGAQLSGIKVA